MTLIETLQNLSSYSADATILAEEPWSAASRAVVREFATEMPVAAMIDEGRSYFLEVSIARELTEDLHSAGLNDPLAVCARLISYAVNDA